MGKIRPAVALFTLCLIPLMILTSMHTVLASPSTSAFEVKVDHVVDIRNGGLVVINDTVTVFTEPGQSAQLQNYTIGIPYRYHTNLDHVFAYETSKPNAKLQVELDFGMGLIGSYAVNVIFPQVVDISNGGQFEFTIVFILSDSISVEPVQVGNETWNSYNASFPGYPSLAQQALKANVTIMIPAGLNSAGNSFGSRGLNFTETTIGSKHYIRHMKDNLSEFSYELGWLEFSGVSGAFDLFEIFEVHRDVEFSGAQQISVSDSYRMVNRADKLIKLNVLLPQGAFAISAYNEFGSIPSSDLKTNQQGAFTNVTITFSIPYDKETEAQFSISYDLPWKNYTSIQTWGIFSSSLTLFEDASWTVRKLTTTIVLPEGASLVSQSTSLSSLQIDPFDTSFSLSFQNVTPFHDLPISFTFKRTVFWESFRPTIWMGSVVAIVGVIAAAWHVYRPTAAPIPTAITRVRVEDLKKFVDSYEEKRRNQREIESLEAQARRGKMPRRVYKVRRTSTESRIASLNRDLTALREKIRAAGPRYSDLMRQLEVAETELQGIEADLSRTEIRYRRGEISAAAYHKLLEDEYRRRDRSQTTVDGVLLRLKEELS